MSRHLLHASEQSVRPRDTGATWHWLCYHCDRIDHKTARPAMFARGLGAECSTIADWDGALSALMHQRGAA